MKQTAYGFMIVATVILGLAIIPLAWCIPMTIRAKRKIPGAPRTIALGICAILFMGLFGIVAGILLLIQNEKEDRQPPKQTADNPSK